MTDWNAMIKNFCGAMLKGKRYASKILLSVFVLSLSVSGVVAQEDPQPGPIADHIGYLLSGSGQWRADNPDYEKDQTEPQQFGMNYRWGPYKKHVMGEIVSIYDDGRIENNWTMFFTYNPVTDRAYVEQTGSAGVYFRGQLGVTESGRHIEAGLIYIPNGTVKSVRDEVEIIDENTRISHVFERDERGAWTKVREWTWRQLQ